MSRFVKKIIMGSLFVVTSFVGCIIHDLDITDLQGVVKECSRLTEKRNVPKLHRELRNLLRELHLIEFRYSTLKDRAQEIQRLFDLLSPEDKKRFFLIADLVAMSLVKALKAGASTEKTRRHTI